MSCAHAVDMSEGDKRGPTITHRFTLCSAIYLDDVLAAVSQCAFTARNEYAAHIASHQHTTLYYATPAHHSSWTRAIDSHAPDGRAVFSFISVLFCTLRAVRCSYPLILTLDASCPVSESQEKIAVRLFEDKFKGAALYISKTLQVYTTIHYTIHTQSLSHLQ